MKKLVWLFAVLICVLGFSFVACTNPDNNSSGSSYSDDGSDYGLGEYENENGNQWWKDSSNLVPDSSSSAGDSSSSSDSSSSENSSSSGDSSSSENSSSSSDSSSSENSSSSGNPEDGDFDFETKPY